MPHGGDCNAGESIGWEGEAPAEPESFLTTLFVPQSRSTTASAWMHLRQAIME